MLAIILAWCTIGVKTVCHSKRRMPLHQKDDEVYITRLLEDMQKSAIEAVTNKNSYTLPCINDMMDTLT